MRIRVNGNDMDFEEPVTLTGLLLSLEIPSKFVAVEHNGELFSGDSDSCRLSDGDRLEIVRFVGGG